MYKFGGLLLIGALTLTGCATATPPEPAPTSDLAQNAQAANDTFEKSMAYCKEMSEGVNEYTDYVGVLMTEGATSSADFLTQEAYISGLRKIAPDDAISALEDFGSVTDQVRAAQANGGNVTLDSTKFKSGTVDVLAYCAG